MSDCRLCPPGLEGCHLCCRTGPHRYIPQRRYVPTQGAWEGAFNPMKITFRKAGQCGILVRDAISKDFRDLEGRDTQPFQEVEIAAQVTLRIEWPGYPPWSSVFRTRDHTPLKTPVTLSRLALEVCRGIEKFVRDMEEREGSNMGCTDPRWRVGSNCALNVDTLMLVSVQRASCGSWEASIRLS